MLSRPSGRHGGGKYPWSGHFLALVAGSLLLPGLGFGKELTINFIDKNPEYKPGQIYVAFCGLSNPANLVGTLSGNPLKLGTNYPLTDLSAGIKLTRFVGGRICVALGTEFEELLKKDDYNPNFNNPSLPNFNLRWDKVEITYDVNDPFSGINLSATDFLGVRLKIQTYRNGELVTTLTWHKPIAEVFHTLGFLSGFSQNAVLTNNATGVPTEGPNGTIINVVRVIAPSTVPEAVTNPYPSFKNYIQYVQTHAIKTKIEGTFSATTTYDFTAQVVSNGALEMTGNIKINSTPEPHTIVILADQLDRGIYTANPECVVDGIKKHVGNDAFGAAVRDALAGFNLGFIGSNEVNPNTAGLAFGESPSFKWYTPNKPPFSLAFAGAQPDHLFYSQYAADLAPVSDAYGFPYTDLTQSPLAHLGDIDRMDITVMPN